MFGKILVATDGSEHSLQAIQEAHKLGLINQDSKVELLRALSFERAKAVVFWEVLETKHQEIRKQTLESLKPQEEWLKSQGIEAKRRLMEDAPEKCVPWVANVEAFDLIVVGRQSKGFIENLTVGHVSQRILEGAEKPILLVPAKSKETASEGLKTVLVPTDFSECSRKGVDAAVQLAKDYGFKVKVVHCQSYSEFFAGFDGFANHEALTMFWKQHREDLLKKLEALVKEVADQGVEVSSSFIDDSVWDGLESAVQETGASLIVMASHGLSGWQKFWIGSVTERVIKHCSVPILVVKNAKGPEDKEEGEAK